MPSLLVMIVDVVVSSIHDDEYDFRIGRLFMMFEFATQRKAKTISHCCGDTVKCSQYTHCVCVVYSGSGDIAQYTPCWIAKSPAEWLLFEADHAQNYPYIPRL